MGAIFADGFEQSRDQGCSHDLEFEGLWIGDLDSRVVIIFMV